MPHFDEIPKAMITTFRMLVKDDQILLGIEGNTALVGEDDDWQVVGSGGVVVWKQTEKRRFTDGEQVKWMINGRKILK